MPYLAELPPPPALPATWRVCREPLAGTLCALVSGRCDPTGVAAEVVAPLAALAVAQGLAPALQRRLDAHGVPPGEPGWEQVEETSRRATMRYLILQQAHAGIARTGERLGVGMVWLKGFALAHTVYPDAAMRPMRDLDVLVGRDDLATLVKALRRRGYRPMMTVVSGPFLSLEHHARLRGGLRDSVVLEVHYRFHEKMGADLGPEHVGWLRSQQVSSRTPTCRLSVPRREAHLLLVAAHAATAEDFTLRSLLDVHLLVDGADTPDWVETVRRAAWLGWSGALRLALGESRRLLGTPVPEEVLQALGRAATDAMGASAAPGTGPRRRSVARALARRRWPHRLRWLAVEILPPVDEMAARYGVERRWLVPLYYPRRWLWAAGELARRAAWRVIGRHRPGAMGESR